MKDSNLTLKFDKIDQSNESYLLTFLGTLTIQLGFQLILKYLERTSRTKNILDVFVNQPVKINDISKKPVRMAYQNSPIHISSISKMLDTCMKCVTEVSRSGKHLDLLKISALLKECGYEFDVTEHLSRKDVNSRKTMVVALITAVVSAISMASSEGTVSGATCATVAIGLFGTRAVDTIEAARPLMYGEVGIRTTKDVVDVCKKWLLVYKGLESIQEIKYELPALEYKLLKKIIYTVGETLRFTGMALRSYSSYM